MSIMQRLKENGLSQYWLMNRLESENITVSQSELSKYINGMRTGPKAIKVVEASTRLIDEYEQRYPRRTV